MRLIGKLGGRNRRFLEHPSQLPYSKHLSPAMVVELSWESQQHR